jgi:hypothetical protein
MLTREDYEGFVKSCSGGDVVSELPDKLEPVWCDEYYFTNPSAEIVLVNLDDSGSTFSYLFDIESERAIAAFGVPIYSKHRRDAARMAGHPLSAGSKFHRGHLIAHSIGGGTDINLAPQLGSLNIGQFRILERRVRKLAQDNVRCLYCVRLIYLSSSQTPGYFEQVVVHSNKAVDYALHQNWE